MLSVLEVSGYNFACVPVTPLLLKSCGCSCGEASEEIRKTTLDARLVQSKLGRQAAALRKEALKLKGKTQGDAWRKAAELEEKACQRIIANVPVVASTCVSAGNVVYVYSSALC